MAKRTILDVPTEFLLEDIINSYKEIIGKISLEDFAKILNTTKQNLSGRKGYGGYLLEKERLLLIKHLTKNDYKETRLYKKLIENINLLVQNELKEDLPEIEIPVRGDVDVSCGHGVSVYNENPTGTCRISQTVLKDYGANVKSTEIVYATGDSMSPEIEAGDALLVDTSQRDIIDGVVYVFSYDGQPMCKRLQKTADSIKAISRNPLYVPFDIDKTLDFRIVGKVVGFMRPIR